MSFKFPPPSYKPSLRTNVIDASALCLVILIFVIGWVAFNPPPNDANVKIHALHEAHAGSRW